MNDLQRYFERNPGRMIHKWTHYFEIYDRHFARYRGRPLTLVEIGVQNGGSLEMWRDYFGPAASIVGVDIDPLCRQFESPGTRVVVGDQADPAFLESLARELGPIDVLVDDGGHSMRQQRTTFDVLFPRVAPDGIYLCEDLHTSYWPEYGGGVREPRSFVEFAKGLVDALNAYHSRDPAALAVSDFTRSAHAIHFYDGVLVVEKRPHPRPEDRRTGRQVLPVRPYVPPGP